MPRERSILVVGAGPAGLTVALELARRGHRPRLVERGADFGPPNESRALAVNPRSMQLLGPSGVAARIAAESQIVSQMRIFAGERRLAVIDIDNEGPWRGLRLLPQVRTEELLAETLATHGIRPEWNTTFTGLERRPGRIQVQLALPDSGTEEAGFDLVIGADGAHSTVRKVVDLDFPGEALEQQFWLADYRYETPVDASYAQARFFDPGVLARFPVDAYTLRYVSTLPDYRDRITHPAAIADIPWESDFQVSFRHVEQMQADGVFLVGDAAHIHSPIGGRGMNLGIEDACWLAWLISEDREADYTRLRLPNVRTVMAETRRNTDMVLMRGRLRTTLRNCIVPLLLRIPALRRPGLRGITGFDTADPPWITSESPT
ncbi:MAG: FAD-dependent monooxygenase [Rhizobiaceae bacterium]|nr:FAD-dependent monooxygenase [Rhizobiaceae bacterium]MCV0406582.1 FAD-dependent monooxygenase [Rhizobiaceae bacterium]